MISPSNSDEYLSARYLAGISDFTADVNGVKIPVYSIGGNDAVKLLIWNSADMIWALMKNPDMDLPCITVIKN